MGFGAARKLGANEVQEDRPALGEAAANHGVRRGGRRGAPQVGRETQKQAGRAKQVARAGTPGGHRRRGVDRLSRPLPGRPGY
jgi:hypothetical protein